MSRLDDMAVPESYCQFTSELAEDFAWLLRVARAAERSLRRERDEARAQLEVTRHEWIVPADHAILPMSDFTALCQATSRLLDLVAANRLVLGEYMGAEYVRRIESEAMAALRRSRMDKEGSDE